MSELSRKFIRMFSLTTHYSILDFIIFISEAFIIHSRFLNSHIAFYLLMMKIESHNIYLGLKKLSSVQNSGCPI